MKALKLFVLPATIIINIIAFLYFLFKRNSITAIELFIFYHHFDESFIAKRFKIGDRIIISIIFYYFLAIIFTQ